MLTVICIYWKGKFRGRQYSADWVIRLQNMVSNTLSVDHRFICLTNDNVDGVECIQLKHDWPGWWSTSTTCT